MKIRFRKKGQGEWLVLFVLLMPFLFFVLTEGLGLPSLVKYLADLGWLMLLALLLGLRGRFPNVHTRKMAALTSQKPVFAGEEVQRVFLPDLIENGYVGAGNTGFALSLCVCLFSMELIRRADWHIVSEREYASEDSYSILKLYGSVNRVAVLPERLYHYRLNDVSLSHTYREDGHRRMRKFYQNSVGLAKQMGYSPEVSKRLAGLYFSQVIGILKQLASTDLDRRQKMNLFREITADPVLQEALAQIDWQYASGAKQVLLHCMRSRRYRWVYGLTALQIRRSKQKHPRHRSCSF